MNKKIKVYVIPMAELKKLVEGIDNDNPGN
jgi:hypothetical protein